MESAYVFISALLFDAMASFYSTELYVTAGPSEGQPLPETLQLKLGGYFVVSYLLSIVTPIFFVTWSLHSFIFGELVRRLHSLVPS
ncbi:hypothetical protein EDB19DRAFT_555441 [Suillus lakei]|nr:hypothetical protein EDB19DRAFT_555441 [Suillus lakei]